MFFRNEYETPGPGIQPDEPEKTGPARFAEILKLEAGALLKLNLLFLASCIPVVTIPPALLAMHLVVRRMVQDQPVDCVYHYRTAFCRHWREAYGAFFLVALPLICAGYGMGFYLRYAGTNPIFFFPFLLCSTVFLVTLLASTYFYGLLGAGRSVRDCVRLALLLGVGRPLRAVLAALAWYGLLAAAVLAFPLSILYLLMLGFSVPCLLGQFCLRTVLKQYGGANGAGTTA